MAGYLSTLVFAVLAATLLIQFGTDALTVSISPSDAKEGRGNTAVITCKLDAGVDDNKAVKKLEIFKNGRKPIVSIDDHSNAKYGKKRYHSRSKSQGSIQTVVQSTWLKLTLEDLVQKDAGYYKCVMHYAAVGGAIKKDIAVGHLTVLRQVDSDIIDRLDALESKGFVDSTLLGRLDTLESKGFVDSTLLGRLDTLESKGFVDSTLLGRLDTLESTGQVDSDTNARLDALESKGDLTVAFSASIIQPAEGFTTIGGSPIIFSTTYVNVGNAYDKTTGIFTVPQGGLYFLHLALTELEHCNLRAKLKVNNTWVGYLTTQNKENEDQSSISTVVMLKAGDKVSAVPNIDGCRIESIDFSMFAGYLIRAM